MTTLYLMTDDLRLEDNPALNLAAQDDALAIVFCIDPKVFQTDRFGCRGIGKHRWQFLRETLQDMNHSLSQRGQVLHLLEQSPLDAIGELLREGRFDRVIRSRAHHANEQRWWNHLASVHEEIHFVEVDSSTLFLEGDIVPLLASFPASFSSFRKKMAGRTFRLPVAAPSSLPHSLEIDSQLITTPDNHGIRGGADTAHQHLDEYFGSRSPSSYKETRNELMGENFSTGLSAFLANGSVSPVEVHQRLLAYESRHGANDSTEWILFELLWREFFRWYGWYHEDKLFEFTGVNGKRPLTSFYRERFLKWSKGTTPWPIVNACMHELNETGWLSNRGRQIVASCLVNEMGVDWRSGASYFAEQLIDLDICSNWGNWQYIAGVGADPRGGRHFDLEKQTEFWDPDGDYRRKWRGEAGIAALDSFDYYDWPISPAAT